MVKHEEIELPKSSSGDTVHLATKAALSLIPHAGGVAAEIFAAVIVPPIEKRREKWMEDVASAIRKLQDSSLTIEDLRENEAFIDCVSRASLLALRTHQEEKLEALRNAVFNSGKPEAPEAAVQQMFLTFIEDLGEWHLRLLKFFQNPPAAGADSSSYTAGSSGILIEKIYPDLKRESGLYSQVIKDLHQRGLINIADVNATMTAHGMVQRRTTGFGEQFLNFISPH